VGPAAAFSLARRSAVTVYVHGGETNGLFWHFRIRPAYDYAAEMARLGHASVVLDMLGYGASDIPNGSDVCYGSLADTVHQIIGELRTGLYDTGARPTPSFSRVALATHSGNGPTAEIEAYSFDDIDALIVAGWVDHPLSGQLAVAAARFAATCATGGEPKRPGAASGYG
jgi:pimeloyl-ACP methyl ester carboxylesterase